VYTADLADLAKVNKLYLSSQLYCRNVFGGMSSFSDQRFLCHLTAQIDYITSNKCIHYDFA